MAGDHVLVVNGINVNGVAADAVDGLFNAAVLKLVVSVNFALRTSGLRPRFVSG